MKAQKSQQNQELEFPISNTCKRAKKIITVSEFSRHEIMKYFHVAENRIVIIPDVWQHYQRIGYDEGACQKYEVEKNKYFFAMSSIEPDKNFKWIMEVAKRNPDQTFAVAAPLIRESLRMELALSVWKT